MEADHRLQRRAETSASASADGEGGEGREGGGEGGCEGVWCAGDASKFCIPGTLEAVGGVHFLPSCYMDDASTHELSAS